MTTGASNKKWCVTCSTEATFHEFLSFSYWYCKPCSKELTSADSYDTMDTSGEIEEYVQKDFGNWPFP